MIFIHTQLVLWPHISYTLVEVRLPTTFICPGCVKLCLCLLVNKIEDKYEFNRLNVFLVAKADQQG